MKSPPKQVYYEKDCFNSNPFYGKINRSWLNEDHIHKFSETNGRGTSSAILAKMEEYIDREGIQAMREDYDRKRQRDPTIPTSHLFVSGNTNNQHGPHSNLERATSTEEGGAMERISAQRNTPATLLTPRCYENNTNLAKSQKEAQQKSRSQDIMPANDRKKEASIKKLEVSEEKGELVRSNANTECLHVSTREKFSSPTFISGGNTEYQSLLQCSLRMSDICEYYLHLKFSNIYECICNGPIGVQNIEVTPLAYFQQFRIEAKSKLGFGQLCCLSTLVDILHSACTTKASTLALHGPQKWTKFGANLTAARGMVLRIDSKKRIYPLFSSPSPELSKKHIKAMKDKARESINSVLESKSIFSGEYRAVLKDIDRFSRLAAIAELLRRKKEGQSTRQIQAWAKESLKDVMQRKETRFSQVQEGFNESFLLHEIVIDNKQCFQEYFQCLSEGIGQFDVQYNANLLHACEKLQVRRLSNFRKRLCRLLHGWKSIAMNCPTLEAVGYRVNSNPLPPACRSGRKMNEVVDLCSDDDYDGKRKQKSRKRKRLYDRDRATDCHKARRKKEYKGTDGHKARRKKEYKDSGPHYPSSRKDFAYSSSSDQEDQSNNLHTNVESGRRHRKLCGIQRGKGDPKRREGKSASELFDTSITTSKSSNPR